ncbi:MAG: DUF5678 domain-containing protein [bacterium]|nr:DUF5678 domain-containing protein [bacterium]
MTLGNVVNHDYSDLRGEYADMWVAIADKKVVAFGEDLTDEKEKSIRKEIGRPIVTLFIEGQARILKPFTESREEIDARM